MFTRRDALETCGIVLAVVGSLSLGVIVALIQIGAVQF